MNPNELRTANLMALAAQARYAKRDPAAAIYAHLPPVPEGHNFQDYASYVGLGNPMSAAMTPDELALRDAINRKYAVYRGAPARDPKAAYQNFGQLTDLVPNVASTTGMSVLDALAALGGVANNVTPLGGNLRDWAESGDFRKQLNEMYQTSLGRIDRERQTTPEGRAELTTRDAAGSFLGQMALGGVGEAGVAAVKGIGTAASSGIDLLQSMFNSQSLARAWEAEKAAAAASATSPTDMLAGLKELGTLASQITNPKAMLNTAKAMYEGNTVRGNVMPAVEAAYDASWLPKRPVGFRVEAPNVKIPATPEFKTMTFPTVDANYGIRPSTIQHSDMLQGKIANTSVEDIIAKMMPDYKTNAAIRNSADAKALDAQIGSKGRDRLGKLLSNPNVVDPKGRPYGTLVSTPQTLLTASDIRKAARDAGQTVDVVREFLKKHFYPN